MSETGFVAIAIHYADPAYEDEFMAHMQRVIAATEGAPGLLEFRTMRSPDTGYLAGYSRWESEEAFRAGLSRIGSLRDQRDPRWSTKPDELITLTVPD
jgi:heme-degrading monooxygenase HmoA